MTLRGRSVAPVNKRFHSAIYTKRNDTNLYYKDEYNIEHVLCRVDDNYDNIIYVSKNGSNSNTGLSINDPVLTITKAIQLVTGLTYLDESVTKGAAGTSDSAANDITEIVEVRQTTTYYTVTTDYLLTSNKVDWSPGGSEPTQGTSYNLVYGYGTSKGISSSNKGVIVILDAGSYTEDIILPDNVLVFGEGASVTGTHILYNYNNFRIATNHVAGEYSVQVELSKADILALYATPKTLVPNLNSHIVEFLSGHIAYTRAGNTYGGGGNVSVNEQGGSARSTTITAANSLGGASSKLYSFAKLNASGGYSLTRGKGLTLNVATGTFTDPGVVEEFTLQITAAPTDAGVATISLNGVSNDLAVVAGSVNDTATAIAALIDAIDGYSAAAVGDTITVTADEAGAQTDAVFNAGTVPDLAGTVTVTQQGVAPATGTAKVRIRYAVYKV